MAIQIGVGNLGGVRLPPNLFLSSTELTVKHLQAMASNFYRQKDSPRYILGHALELAFIGAGIIAALILVFGYSAINKKRQRRIDEGALNKYTSQELSAKGDKAITFRYIH